MNAREQMIEMIRARAHAHHGASRVRVNVRVPRPRPPSLIALEYSKALMPILDLAHDMVTREVLPKAKREIEARDRASALAREDAASVSETIARLADKMASRVGPQRMGDVAEKFARRTSDFQKEQLRAQVQAAISVDISALEPNITKQIAGFVSDNVSLIKSVPKQYFAQIEQSVAEAVSSGMRWETLAKELEERHGVAASRVQLIARDQVGKLYGNLNATRQQNLGINRFFWRTAEDERVRDEHVELDGQSFEYANPPDEGLPGNPVLCRCYADPDFSAILASLL